jgi:hypothetical protein
VVYDQTVTAQQKEVKYSNTSILAALTEIANAFSCEWWVVGKVVHFGLCKDANSPIELTMNSNVQYMSESKSNDTFATRIYPFGSDVNIPDHYRKTLQFVVTEKDDTNHYIRLNKPVTVDMFEGVETPGQETIWNWSAYTSGKKQFGLNMQTNLHYGTNNEYLKNWKLTTFNSDAQSFTGFITGTIPCDIEDLAVTLRLKYVAYYGGSQLSGNRVATLSAKIVPYLKNSQDPSQPAMALLRSDPQPTTGTCVQSITASFANIPAKTLSMAYDTLYIEVQDYEEYLREALSPYDIYSMNSVECWFYNGEPYYDSSYTYPITPEEGVIYVDLYTGEWYEWMFSGWEYGHEQHYWENRTPVCYVEMYVGAAELAFGSAESYLTTDTNVGSVIINPQRQPSTDDDSHLIQVLGTWSQISVGMTITFDYPIKGNIPTGWFSSTDTSDAVKTGVVSRNLRLPILDSPVTQDGIKITSDYVQDASVSDANVVELVCIFPDEYPRFIIDEWTLVEVPVRKKYANSDEEYDTIQYEILVPSLTDFDEKYIIGDLKAVFLEGDMSGMTFDLAFVEVNENGALFAIVWNEDYGRELPDEMAHPDDADKFVMTGIDTTFQSTGSIASAENSLQSSAINYLKQILQYKKTYEVALMPSYSKTHFYGAGTVVKLVNDALFANDLESRIYGFEYPLDKPYRNFIVYVGDSAKYSRLDALEAKINSMAMTGSVYGGGMYGEGGMNVQIIGFYDDTTPTDNNVYSALKSYREFLSKTHDDTASGQITHEKTVIANEGVQFGDFNEGLLGHGGKIDGYGFGEMRGLKLWEWLDVPELRYNRVSIYTGIRWDTFGGGIIESVTPNETLGIGSGKLKLDDGEIGAIAVGDLCMGIWHDRNGNAEVSSDDHQGNFTFAGFKTIYFQITGVSGSHNENFTYILRSTQQGGNGIHPFAMMHFAGRGNISNTARQSFIYTTTEYSLALTGVSTWNFQSSNYYQIVGHLEGFSMQAIDRQGNPYTKHFHGYGQVFGNAYIFGQIDQFERIGYRASVDQSKGGSLAPGETEYVTVTVWNGYGEDVTSRFTHLAVTRNTGDEASDAVWNAQHTSVNNPFPIAFTDLGIDGIHQLMAVFTVTASDEVNGIEAQQATVDYFS